MAPVLEANIGRHRVWGAIEVSSTSSSSSNNVADEKHGYSARQLAESVRYLRDRKLQGQRLDGDMAPASSLDGQVGGRQAAAFEGMQSASEVRSALSSFEREALQNARVFADTSRKAIASSTNDSESWDVDGELKGMAAEMRGRDPDSSSTPGRAAAPTTLGWEGSTSNLPSLGSTAHAVGTCKPCHYANSRAGCEKGASCGFCHYQHPKRRRSQPTKVDRGRGECYDEDRGISSIPARMNHMLISL